MENIDRVDLFARMSGTSMATPIVSGAVALIIQKFKQAGIPITAAAVKKELLSKGVASTGQDVKITGKGRLILGNL